MSKYYFYNDQLYSEEELRHARPGISPLKGIEKENHKYIKREWKNGKWVYTYPGDPTGKKTTASVVKPVSTAKSVQPDSKSSPKAISVVNTGKGAVSKMLAGSNQQDPADSILKENVIKENVIKENVIKENVIKENAIDDKSSKTDDNTKSKKDKNLWDSFVDGFEDVVDWFEEKAEDTMDAISEAADDFAENASEWLNNLFENYQTDYKKAKEKSDAALIKLDEALSNYRKAMSADTLAVFDENMSAEDKRKVRAEYEAASKALEAADREALMARIEYINAENNPLRKLDDWFADVTGEEKDPESSDDTGDNALSQLTHKSSENTADEDMAMINPTLWDPESNKTLQNLYNDNCGVCTMAYDLRRRGYDVEAGSDVVTMEDGYEGLTIDEIASFYEDCTRSDFVYDSDLLYKYGEARNMKEKLEHLERDFLAHGEGARGNLCVFWNGGGGHSMSIEVENGKVIIRDAQINQTFTLQDFASMIKSFSYLRTDNREFSDDILQYVHNREEDKR